MSYSSRTRIVLLSSLAMLLSMSSAWTSAEERARQEDRAWSFEILARRAQHCAERPFEASPPLPLELRRLDYDSYRLIAFEPSAAIWKNSSSPFALECFHRGYLFSDKVALNLVEDGHSHSLPFNRRMFQYRGKLSDITVPDDLGFAGFRVLHSAVHCTINIVILRFWLYCISALALWFMVARAALGAFT